MDVDSEGTVVHDEAAVATEAAIIPVHSISSVATDVLYSIPTLVALCVAFAVTYTVVLRVHRSGTNTTWMQLHKGGFQLAFVVFANTTVLVLSVFGILCNSEDDTTNVISVFRVLGHTEPGSTWHWIALAASGLSWFPAVLLRAWLAFHPFARTRAMSSRSTSFPPLIGRVGMTIPQADGAAANVAFAIWITVYGIFNSFMESGSYLIIAICSLGLFLGAYDAHRAMIASSGRTSLAQIVIFAISALAAGVVLSMVRMALVDALLDIDIGLWKCSSLNDSDEHAELHSAWTCDSNSSGVGDSNFDGARIMFEVLFAVAPTVRESTMITCYVAARCFVFYDNVLAPAGHRGRRISGGC